MEYDIEKIAYILQTSKYIAIVGLSAKPERPSYQVAKYLMEHNYTVIPVNPGYQEILGEKCYATLFDIPFPVNIVDVFRRSQDVLPVVRSAIQIQAPYIWLQEGIRNEEAVSLAHEHDVTIIQDLCIKKMHRKCQKENLIR